MTLARYCRWFRQNPERQPLLMEDKDTFNNLQKAIEALQEEIFDIKMTQRGLLVISLGIIGGGAYGCYFNSTSENDENQSGPSRSEKFIKSIFAILFGIGFGAVSLYSWCKGTAGKRTVDKFDGAGCSQPQKDYEKEIILNLAREYNLDPAKTTLTDALEFFKSKLDEIAPQMQQDSVSRFVSV